MAQRNTNTTLIIVMRGSCNYVLWTMTRKLESKDSLSSSGKGAVHTNNSYRCRCLVINMPKALWLRQTRQQVTQPEGDRNTHRNVAFVLHLRRFNKDTLLQKRAGRKRGERRVLHTETLYVQKEQKLCRNFF